MIAMDDYHGGYASERWDDLLLWANLLSGKLHLTILLAPSGALVFIMVYYIPASKPLFQIFQILQILK